MSSLLLNLILLFNVICGFVPESNEDDFDPIIYYLLNGNETELFEPNIESNINLGGEPMFSGGLWKCGICQNVTESQLIYSETNEVDTNIDYEDFLQVQVGLSFDEMRCITIDSDDESTVARASGDCAGPTVTLIVADSKRFLVKVYGNDHGHAFTPSKLNA
ncbi:PREDICTED: uncharacterized protein LOC106111655 [Papilio polytes]|uniref:uncharacterized protein LOC106111655 n=1 Tax=Papilio polytes TaxID=76194 RepID=UPI0006766736|nr:PREDICTED: uncharacterized protein LOC106111655 [Papilio polytes]